MFIYSCDILTNSFHSYWLFTLNVIFDSHAKQQSKNNFKYLLFLAVLFIYHESAVPPPEEGKKFNNINNSSISTQQWQQQQETRSLTLVSETHTDTLRLTPVRFRARFVFFIVVHTQKDVTFWASCDDGIEIYTAGCLPVRSPAQHHRSAPPRLTFQCTRSVQTLSAKMDW